jgi:hypothetical protein
MLTTTVHTAFEEKCGFREIRREAGLPQRPDCNPEVHTT